MTDFELFGAVAAFSAPVKHKRGPGLRSRILEYFRAHKYESFTEKQIVRQFASAKPESVTKMVASLKKSCNIVATGEARGSGIEGHCLIFNPHRYK